MSRSKFMSSIVTLVLLLLISVDVSAQQVSSFEQLQLLVRPGDKITVVSMSTLKRTVGRIKDLSPSTLKLNADGTEHTYSQQDVMEIQQRRPDSLSNGAKWGALTVGGGVSALLIIACSVDSCAREDIPFLVGAAAIYTAIGTGVGVGIDALIKTRQPIYRNPNRSASTPGFHVAPVLSTQRKGVSMSLTF